MCMVHTSSFEGNIAIERSSSVPSWHSTLATLPAGDHAVPASQAEHRRPRMLPAQLRTPVAEAGLPEALLQLRSLAALRAVPNIRR